MSSAIPIRNGGDQSIPIQFSRNSFAHSQGMGGISWGGASVGSWLRDEVLMATKNKDYPGSTIHDSFGDAASRREGTPNKAGPHTHNDSHGALAQESLHTAHHSLSEGVGGEHEGMELFDEHPTYFPSLEANFCRDYTCCGRLLPTLHDLLRHYEEQHISPSPPDEPPVMRRMQNIETVSTNDVFLPFNQPVLKDDDEMQGLGLGSNIEAGFGVSDMDMGTPPASQPIFAPPSFQPLTAQSLGFGKKGYNPNSLGSTESTTNAPNRGRNSAQTSSNSSNGNQSASFNSFNSFGDAGSAASMLQNRLGSLGDVGANMSLGDDEEPTIDDPARQLYMLERSENKPFKCPVIGCEKTYKNQNGLKYHRQHGHQNQTLHLNDDGTYSIIDPLSNTPYPDGMGMEKDKPYRCEICGKRYKNLNGLKYHRAHSTH